MAHQAFDRGDVLAALRPSIADSLRRFEDATGLVVIFPEAPPDFTVRAYSYFDPHRGAALVGLGQDWQDRDVAHETEHLRLQLAEGYGVLACRTPERNPRTEPASTRVLTYVQDEVVYTRLIDMGLKFDGEIIDVRLFRLHREVTRRLEAGAQRGGDGMAHLDPLGRGVLCRAAYYVQAALLCRRGLLSASHLAGARRFLYAFEKNREGETEYARRVLALFDSHDVETPDGHDAILVAWTALEGIDEQVGVSRFEKTPEGTYRLPFPSR